ncbi:hypothetical protein PP175_24750 [Aneurinibacillus sp. Ricciae_BoGa-3]|uniref:hypothetical protein n=1 Tax=Aneurinibacillus sp. Ricciae_BoGa-3 TaxID=3022697 RepID=UPI0023423504|nr:hypothetical protein [Aneurinibacillus sp. Ricciae_BoGa-3]WCK54448.1 hypothetical protein PP175_24750 [Aneurinibacillus sp. Ricciae_BoGa-3]
MIKLANLALKESCYGQSWNIPGAGVITGREIIQIAQSEAGRRSFIIPVGKTMMKTAGFFNPFLREVAEMIIVK